MHISQFLRLAFDLLLVLEEFVKAQVRFALGIPVNIVSELLALQFPHVLSHIIIFFIFVILAAHFLKHRDVLVQLVLLETSQLLSIQKAPLLRLLVENFPSHVLPAELRTFIEIFFF